MPKNVVPVGNYVVLEMSKAPEKDGILFLPQSDKVIFMSNTGTIVGLGTGDDDKPVELSKDLKIGDKVVILTDTKKKIKIMTDDGPVWAVPPEEIIAKIED